MGIEALPNQMGIPVLLITAVVVIAIAALLLDFLFPPSRNPTRK